MRHALAALGMAATVTLGGAILSAVPTAPSHAGPFVAWSQYKVSGDRFACRDRAIQFMQSVRSWRVTPGKQHVYGEDDQFTAWVRCWTLPDGQSSIATIVVSAFRVSDAARQLRNQIRDALRQPSVPSPPGNSSPSAPNPSDPGPDEPERKQ